ncbi:MAG: glycosyltransferase [Gemmatimonadetes bacterium]|nr:glycosyltransferase [Gemmatimonadota bacterium]
MSPLRVLFLAHSFPRTSGDAAGSFLLHLARALGEQDVEVRVVAPSAPGLPGFEEVGGIPTMRFRYAPPRWETLAYTGNMAAEVRGSLAGKLAMLGYLLSGTGAAGRAIHGWAPDVVHAHWWFPGGLTGVLPARWHGVPMVTTMHGSDVRLAVGVRAAHPLLRHVLRSSAAVTTVSSWLAAQVRSIAATVEPLVEPMPVATDLFAPATAARERLLFVGRLNRQKGIADLIEAMARTHSAVGLDVIGDGPDRPTLEARARELGVAQRVWWHRALPQPDVVPYYQRAIATVMPGLDEGLGLVAVESLLCETPVIAYASGGTVDVVEPNRTGLLVPPGSIDGLAAAIDTLATGTGGPSMGQEGRRRMLDRFSPAAVAARYAAVYRQVRKG